MDELHQQKTELKTALASAKVNENMAAFEKWQAGKGEILFEPGNCK